MSQNNITMFEHQIMPLVAVGLSNKEIASTVHRSEHTINSYVKGLMKKCGVKNRAALAVLLVITKQICITENDIKRAKATTCGTVKNLAVFFAVGVFWGAMFKTTLTADQSRETRKPSRQAQQTACRVVRTNSRTNELLTLTTV